jgi:tetratricopeptide (TPR) repeat protein
MSRSPRQAALKQIAKAFAIAFLVLVSSVVQAARPQASDNTPRARQHYQNAVTAINRDDWQTAKSELLRAERLAPQNALVHYDLALAYSHTGQNKSALAELNKALQLGLPADQKQAAAQLRRQLSTLNGGAVPQNSNGEARTEPPQPVPVFKAPPKSGPEPGTPSIEETLKYLNARVDSAFVKTDVRYVPGQFSVSPDRRSIWWSRFEDYNIAFGYYAFFEAKVTDLDADAIAYYDSGSVTIDCKASQCWRQWTAESTFEPPDEEPPTDKLRQELLQVQYKTDNSTLAANLRGLGIPTTGDAQVAARFVRALAHLVRLMQELPENRNLGADDPFKQ